MVVLKWTLICVALWLVVGVITARLYHEISIRETPEEGWVYRYKAQVATLYTLAGPLGLALIILWGLCSGVEWLCKAIAPAFIKITGGKYADAGR